MCFRILLCISIYCNNLVNLGFHISLGITKTELDFSKKKKIKLIQVLDALDPIGQICLNACLWLCTTPILMEIDGTKHHGCTRELANSYKIIISQISGR